MTTGHQLQKSIWQNIWRFTVEHFQKLWHHGSLHQYFQEPLPEPNCCMKTGNGRFSASIPAWDQVASSHHSWWLKALHRRTDVTHKSQFCRWYCVYSRDKGNPGVWNLKLAKSGWGYVAIKQRSCNLKSDINQSNKFNSLSKSVAHHHMLAVLIWMSTAEMTKH